MANELAGRNDKYGNRYENNCIINTIIDVVAEKILAFSFEPLGQDEVATDILITEKNGAKKFVQCKERNGDNNNWSFSALKRYKLLSKWKTHLDRDSYYTVSLMSPLPFIGLEDLIKRAKNDNNNPHDFLNYQVLNSPDTARDFENYCSQLGLNYNDESDVAIAINYLKRTKVETQPDGYFKSHILDRIKLYFTGDSETIYNSLLNLTIMDNIMGNNIDNAWLNKFFKEKNILLRNLSNDEQNFPTINRLNGEYKASFLPINDELILRDELQTCIDKISNEESIVIHGKSGYGKTGVVTSIIKYLDEKNILYLAIRLDKKIPTNNVYYWSRKLGFNASVSYCLNAFSNDKPCILILDQLDALRWTQYHTRDSIDVICSLLDEIKNINIERSKKISVVLVSRTFDLENDNNIKRVIDDNWSKIKIDLLAEKDVKKIVGSGYDNLNVKLKNLLRIPSNLFIWNKLDENFKNDNILSTGNLIEKWWKDIEYDGRNNGFQSSELMYARNKIFEQMNNKNKLSISTYLLDIDSNILDFLRSKGFIIDTKSNISFSHQSIYDFYMVKKMISEYDNGCAIAKLLGPKEKQFPMIRYQLQMFLEELYTNDISAFIKAVEQIITSCDIRSYIKYVAYEVLGLVPESNKAIEKFILEYIEKDEYFNNFVNDVFMGHEVFIVLLIRNNVFDRWFQDDDKKNIVINLLTSINFHFPSEAVKFIKKNILCNKDTDSLLKQCFSYDIQYDTDELFDLRLKMYDIYADWMDFYVNLDKLLKCNESRGIKLVSYLLCNISNKKRPTRYSYDDSIEYSDETKISGDIAVIDKLMPLVPIYYTKEYDMHEWVHSNYTEHNIQRIAISLLKNATVNLIRKNADDFWKVFSKYLNSGSIIHNEIILYGLLNMPLSEGKKVLSYLFFSFDIDRNIFEYTSDCEESILYTKKILEKFVRTLNTEEYFKLENSILMYKPKDMVEIYKRRLSKEKTSKSIYLVFWGDLQFELLKVIPNDLLTLRANSLLQVLNRKFKSGKSYKFNKDYVKSYNVISPINNKILSDKSWLEILKNEKIVNSKENFGRVFNKSKIIESSLYEFQSSFALNIKEEPERFINLVINNKDIVLQPFIDTLFNSIAYSAKLDEIPTDLLEKMMLSFEWQNSNSRIIDICEIISRKSGAQWSDKIVVLLKNIFLNIKDKKISMDSIVENTNNIEEAEKIENYIINTPMGNFAFALKNLLYQGDELFWKFKKIIQSMIDSDDMCTRYSVLYILNSCLDINKEWTIENIVKLFRVEENLGFRNSRNILFFCYCNSESCRKDIIEIINSSLSINSKIIKINFSRLLVDLYVNFGEFSHYIDKLPNDETISKTVLDMLIEYLEDSDKREIVKQKIIKVLDSNNIEFNAYRMFNTKRIDVNKDSAFLLQICKKCKGKEILGAFNAFINKEAISLKDYKKYIFELAEGCIKNCSNNDYNLFWHLESLIELIVKLFDETYEDDSENETRERCLEIWDKMFEKHIGSIRRISKNISNL